MVHQVEAGPQVEANFRQVKKLMQDFLDGSLSQEKFCEKIKPLGNYLVENGQTGTTGILKSYPNRQEAARAALHELLHVLVNIMYGIPTGPIGAIKDSENYVWGFSLMNPEKAQGTPRLREKLKKAQSAHERLDKLNL